MITRSPSVRKKQIMYNEDIPELPACFYNTHNVVEKILKREIGCQIDVKIVKTCDICQDMIRKNKKIRGVDKTYVVLISLFYATMIVDDNRYLSREEFLETLNSCEHNVSKYKPFRINIFNEKFIKVFLTNIDEYWDDILMNISDDIFDILKSISYGVNDIGPRPHIGFSHRTPFGLERFARRREASGRCPREIGDFLTSGGKVLSSNSLKQYVIYEIDLIYTIYNNIRRDHLDLVMKYESYTTCAFLYMIFHCPSSSLLPRQLFYRIKRDYDEIIPDLML